MCPSFLYGKVLTQTVNKFMHEPEEVTHVATGADNVGTPCTSAQSASFLES